MQKEARDIFSAGLQRQPSASDMQKLVDSYECEWKNAIETPEILNRFRHFVNSDEPDRSVIFVAERGQIRPARPEEKDEQLETA